jgi:hypothetical protein
VAQPLGHSRALAAVSAAQLATELAGMVVGLRRRHPYDVFWMHGDPATITRDAVFRGTALSAPVPNMLIQAAMTAVVVRWPSRRAAQALGGWGASQEAPLGPVLSLTAHIHWQAAHWHRASNRQLRCARNDHSINARGE